MNPFPVNPSDVIRISKQFSSRTSSNANSNPLVVFERNEDNFSVLMYSLMAGGSGNDSNMIHSYSNGNSNHNHNHISKQQEEDDILDMDSSQFMSKLLQQNQETDKGARTGFKRGAGQRRCRLYR